MKVTISYFGLSSVLFDSGVNGTYELVPVGYGTELPLQDALIWISSRRHPENWKVIP